MQEHHIPIHFLRISENLSGQRIDNFLSIYLKTVPKSRIYRMIRIGEIRVNKKRVKFYYKLCIGDLLKIPSIKYITIRQFPIYSSKKLIYLKNTIIYEDNFLLILNKPAGVAVHHGSGLKFNIIDGLRNIFYSKSQFLELVHRLDRDTSGALLIAKKRSVLVYLQEQWRLQKIQKEYLGLVCGTWNMNVTSISAPLLKKRSYDKNVSNTMIIDFKDGKFSKTYCRIHEYFKQLATLLTITPITGRTHQIRVHTQYVMHPIIGDNIYGNNKINTQFKKLGLNRLFLHASSIRFTHPNTKEILHIYAPIDQIFHNCLSFLKKFKNLL